MRIHPIKEIKTETKGHALRPLNQILSKMKKYYFDCYKDREKRGEKYVLSEWGNFKEKKIALKE